MTLDASEQQREPRGWTCATESSEQTVVATTDRDRAARAGHVSGHDDPGVVGLNAELGKIQADGRHVQHAERIRHRNQVRDRIAGGDGQALPELGDPILELTDPADHGEQLHERVRMCHAGSARTLPYHVPLPVSDRSAKLDELGVGDLCIAAVEHGARPHVQRHVLDAGVLQRAQAQRDDLRVGVRPGAADQLGAHLIRLVVGDALGILVPDDRIRVAQPQRQLGATQRAGGQPGREQGDVRAHQQQLPVAIDQPVHPLQHLRVQHGTERLEVVEHRRLHEPVSPQGEQIEQPLAQPATGRGPSERQSPARTRRLQVGAHAIGVGKEPVSSPALTSGRRKRSAGAACEAAAASVPPRSPTRATAPPACDAECSAGP